MRPKTIFPTLLMAAATTWLLIAALSPSKVVRLSYGITRLDLTGQQSESMAVLANRENFNAHSFDVLSLYIKVISSDPNASKWSIIPVFDGDKERLVVTVGGGADCLLHDFRLVRDSKDQPLRLVLADRSLGESFADPGIVTFSFYVLRFNKDGEVGRPLYYFERTKLAKSKHKYCDVGEAFKMELGLGDYRIDNA